MCAGSYPPGVLTVMHRGTPIDVRNDPRGERKTLVLFHAALARPTIDLPVFTGASISRTLSVNRVFVADPSLYIDDNLTLAWYAGSSKQWDLQHALSKILRALIPESNSVVTFGASGGGFAALYYASQFADALAIPINPQINLKHYSPRPVKKWLELGWGLEPNISNLDTISAVTDSGKAFREGSPANVWYVQNTGDKNHMDNHFRPFMDSLPAGHRVSPLLLDVGPGHVPPKKETLVEILGSAAEGSAPLTK